MRAWWSLGLLAMLTAGCTDDADMFPNELPQGWSYDDGSPRSEPVDTFDEDGDFEGRPVSYRFADLSSGTLSAEIAVVTYGSKAEAIEATSGIHCDDGDMFHILRDGKSVAFVGTSPELEDAFPALDAMARQISAETGASRVC